jgi:Homeodomain-like domain
VSGRWGRHRADDGYAQALPVISWPSAGRAVVALGGAVLTVEADPGSVERRLAAGDLGCPGCGHRLAPWGWAVARVLRGVGAQVVRVRPRRSRCAGCGVTHVLLPVFGLARRADLAEVIGAALVARAKGTSVRAIAGWLGRPLDTVRGWLRRFAERAEAVRVVFTVLLAGCGPDPVMPAPTRSPVGDAVAAIVGAAGAVAARWPVLGVVSPWLAASAATGGRLLAPSWP